MFLDTVLLTFPAHSISQTMMNVSSKSDSDPFLGRVCLGVGLYEAFCVRACVCVCVCKINSSSKHILSGSYNPKLDK